jgi:hypothetical protein
MKVRGYESTRREKKINGKRRYRNSNLPPSGRIVRGLGIVPKRREPKGGGK